MTDEEMEQGIAELKALTAEPGWFYRSRLAALIMVASVAYLAAHVFTWAVR